MFFHMMQFVVYHCFRYTEGGNKLVQRMAISDIFSGIYAVPTIILTLCQFILTSLLKLIFSVVIAVRAFLCVINVQLGYYQRVGNHHYILDLRPEYGYDILQVTSTVLRGFIIFLSCIRKIKRHFWHSDHQVANHYILDLKPEYGGDILHIASIVLCRFRILLSCIRKIKIHFWHNDHRVANHYILDLRPDLEYGGDILQIANIALCRFTILLSFIRKIKRRFLYNDHQPANHYILDLRPEYGGDILRIASIVLHEFTCVLLKIKRRGETNEYSTFVPQEEAIVFVGPLQNTDRTDDDTVLWMLPGGQVRLYYMAMPSVPREAIIFLRPIQDTDSDIDDLLHLECHGQSKFYVVLSDGTIVPEAQIVTRLLCYLDACSN